MKHKNTLLYIIPAAFFAGLLCYAVYNALAIYIPQQRERRDFAELRESVQTSAQEPRERDGDVYSAGDSVPDADWLESYRTLQERNGDFVGWLKIEDSEIDYPVMKSAEEDPEYYLHRDFDGNDSSSGCLFIGGGCDEDSDCFVIYGHKMHNNSMFGSLDSFLDFEYAEAHGNISFITPEEKRAYRVFAVFRTKIYQDRDDVFQYYESVGDLDEEAYQYTVDSVRAMSALRLPDAPAYPAQLLFLSTCSYHTEDGRFVVAAYRVEL